MRGKLASPVLKGRGHGNMSPLPDQAQGILALDFFTADLLNGTKVYVLAVIEHGTRRVRVLGATGHPAQSWVVQQALNLLMDLEDAGTRVKFVLHDRDASFTAAFDAVFQAAGARVGPSLAASSANTSEPRKRPGQEQRPSSGTPQVPWVNIGLDQEHAAVQQDDPGFWDTARRGHRVCSYSSSNPD
ncbi:MAG: Integrase catalytic region [Actinomycetia bacterium]|nr:Integrase catalytic region [Actinomycetes bacterium]